MQDCQADMATVRKAMSALQEQHTSDLASVRRTQELQQQQQQQLQQEAECKGCKSLQADMRSLQASQSTSDSQIAALSQQLLSFRMLMGSFASQIAAAAAPAQQLPARAAAEASNSALPGLPSNSDRVRQPVADLQLANGVIRYLLQLESTTWVLAATSVAAAMQPDALHICMHSRYNKHCHHHVKMIGLWSYGLAVILPGT